MPGGPLIPISIDSFTVDAPARAYLKCTRYYPHAACCHFCDQTTRTVVHKKKRKRVCQNFCGEKRDDVQFKNREKLEHHAVSHKAKASTLEEFGYGHVSQFPLDSMHLCDLRVARQILSSFIHQMKSGGSGELSSDEAQTAAREIKYRLLKLENINEEYLKVKSARSSQKLFPANLLELSKRNMCKRVRPWPGLNRLMQSILCATHCPLFSENSLACKTLLRRGSRMCGYRRSSFLILMELNVLTNGRIGWSSRTCSPLWFMISLSITLSR